MYINSRIYEQNARPSHRPYQVPIQIDCEVYSLMLSTTINTILVECITQLVRLNLFDRVLLSVLKRTLFKEKSERIH